MYREILRAYPFRYALLPLLIERNDAVSKDTDTAKTADISAVKTETGMDRLVRMFSYDEFDNLSTELTAVIQVACMSSFVGAVYGGFMSSRTAYMDFVRSNQATAFHDHLEAKKRLQDKITLSFGKGAFRWGWRLSLFSTSYVGLSTAISVYRGKNGIVEHLIAGTVSGMAYKFPMGPKGWIVGGGLGLVLGAIAGSLTYGMLKFSGISMEEVRYWQYKWKENRLEKWKDGIEKQVEKDQLHFLHAQKVGPDGNTLDNLVKNESTVKSQ